MTFSWTVVSVAESPNGDIVVRTQDIPQPEMKWMVLTGTNSSGQTYQYVEWGPTGDTIQAPHSIVVSAEAIGARMATYGLTTEHEAFEAILREHGCRISPDITLPAKPYIDACGGLNTAVSISYGSGTKTARDSLIDKHRTKITSARTLRWNDPQFVQIRTGKI